MVVFRIWKFARFIEFVPESEKTKNKKNERLPRMLGLGRIYIYIYVELRLSPSTGILHLAVDCLGKNPKLVILSGMTLPRVVHGPLVF